MKAIKYLVMGALMLGFGTQVKAQDGSKADVDAVKKMISSITRYFTTNKVYYTKINYLNKKGIFNSLNVTS